MVDLLSDSNDNSDAAVVTLDAEASHAEESDAEESDAESLPAALQPPRPAETAGQTAQVARPADASHAGADVADADATAAGPTGSQGAAADNAQPTRYTASMAVRSPPSAGDASRDSQVRLARPLSAMRSYTKAGSP